MSAFGTTQHEAIEALDNRRTLHYPGDVRQAVGQLVGPSIFGELFVVDEVAFDEAAGVSTARLRYATRADLPSVRQGALGTVVVEAAPPARPFLLGRDTEVEVGAVRTGLAVALVGLLGAALLAAGAFLTASSSSASTTPRTLVTVPRGTHPAPPPTVVRTIRPHTVPPTRRTRGPIHDPRTGAVAPLTVGTSR